MLVSNSCRKRKVRILYTTQPGSQCQVPVCVLGESWKCVGLSAPKSRTRNSVSRIGEVFHFKGGTSLGSLDSDVDVLMVRVLVNHTRGTLYPGWVKKRRYPELVNPISV